MGEKKDRKEDTKMLQVGTKGTQTITVTPSLTAKEMGSGALEVLATPAMIALMEKTAWTSVQPDLEEGWGWHPAGGGSPVRHPSGNGGRL